MRSPKTWAGATNCVFTGGNANGDTVFPIDQALGLLFIVDTPGPGSKLYWNSCCRFQYLVQWWREFIYRVSDFALPDWTRRNGTFTEVAATPLAAALPLFANGLGALGPLGWRRKRKAAAIATV
jgi:hypothetical protein